MNTELYTEDEVLDFVQAEIASRPQVDCPVKHVFTKGLYSRELLMPAGLEISSKIHKSQHQWVIPFGVVDIYVNGQGWQRIAGYAKGITEPGTRRVFKTYADTLLITFHPTDIEPAEHTHEAYEAAALLIEQQIIDARENPYLPKAKEELTA